MLNKYIDRLINEWNQHGKIVIAVDFDSTIYPWHTIDNVSDRDRTIDLLKKAHHTGAYIVVNTCSNIDRYKEIEDYCKDKGLKIDGINTTPIDLPYGKTGKIYANIYLDDRAGLNESLDILEEAMYHRRSQIEKEDSFFYDDVA